MWTRRPGAVSFVNLLRIMWLKAWMGETTLSHSLSFCTWTMFEWAWGYSADRRTRYPNRNHGSSGHAQLNGGNTWTARLIAWLNLVRLSVYGSHTVDKRRQCVLVFIDQSSEATKRSPRSRLFPKVHKHIRCDVGTTFITKRLEIIKILAVQI